MANDITGRIKIDAKSAAAELAAIDKASKQTGESIEEIGTKGQAMARIINESAAKLEAELNDTERMAKALGDALGPELTARADLDSIVADFRRVGLTADDVEADVEQLAAALKRMDDVGQRLPDVQRNAGGARGGVDDLSDSARGANSALANMIGNSAQDLGALGGIAGSAGVAIGQMAEYASDARLAGEGLGSAFGSMLKVAAPIAAIAVGTQLLGKWLGDASEEQKKLSEETKQWVQSLIDAAEAGKDLTDTNRDLVDERVKKWLEDLGDNADDVTNRFDELGITADDVRQAFSDGTGPVAELAGEYRTLNERVVEGSRNWIQAEARLREHARATGQDADALVNRYKAGEYLNGVLGDEAARSVAAREAAEAATSWYTRQSTALGDLADTAKSEAAPAYEIIAGKISDANDALDRQEREAREARDALRDHADAVYDLYDAEQDLESAVADAQKVMDEIAKGEFTGSQRDARKAVIDVARAADEQAQALVTSKNLSMDSAAGMAEWARSMMETAGTLKGPMRDEVLNHISRVTGIPKSIVTSFGVEVDPGALAALESLLERLGRVAQNRFATVSAVGTRGGARIDGPQTGAGKADGGPTAAGVMYPILERGESEILTEGGRSFLLAARNGQVTPLPSSGNSPLPGTTQVVNVTVQGAFLGTKADVGRWVIDGLRAAQRQGASLTFLGSGN